MSNINFDWKTYINNYEDLKKAGINTKEKALQHWNNHGKKEGRTDKNIHHNIIIKKNFIIKKLDNIELNDIKNIINKNIIVITSKIIVTQNKFTYVNTRSIYSEEERFNQTIETINSIKKYIPDYYIILFDNSKLDDKKKYILINIVNKFINIIDDDNLNHNTDVCDLKLIGELSQHISLYDNYLKYIDFSKNKNYFKISGRYVINNTFNYNNYNNNLIIFKRNMELKHIKYYYTSFFKINITNINYFYEKMKEIILKYPYEELKKYDYEVLIPKILEDKIQLVNNLGITQRIAVWNKNTINI